MMRSVVCLLSVFLAATRVTAEDGSVARLSMKDMFSSITNSAIRASGPLAGISVTVEAPRQQMDVEKGLHVDVTLRNNGTNAAVVEDPGDFIQIQLLDSKGYPVDLPPVTTGRFVCSQSGSSNRSPEVDARRPFEIVRPMVARDSKTRDDASAPEARMDAERLILPAGKEYRLTIQIRKTLADPKGFAGQQEERDRTRADLRSPAPAPPAAVSIPPGRYSARIQIALVPATGTEESRQLESDVISIELKPAPESQGSQRK